MISKKGKERLRKFIESAQKHLQWQRMEKWRLEQAGEKGVKLHDLNLRIEEVTRDIDLAYRKATS